MKRNKLVITNIIISFIVVIILLLVLPVSFSRFASLTNSNTNIDVAFYLLDTNYYRDSIILNEIVPRNEPYVYNIKVANNDGVHRLETKLEYDFTIKATTNLPLTYDLYLNENYTDNNASSIITSNTDADSDGTYFITMSTPKEYFNYISDEENMYQLVVYFPSQYTSYNYQDIIELIDINIDSKQIIDE